MKYTTTKTKRIAIGLLVIWCMNMIAPSLSFALTSGPAQPEVAAFQPAGISDMVDLQTGELKYNIPLLDIDGYPINLSYQSNAGIDDEASWVGLGWSLNPGAINRQVRGVPDDFGGKGDTLETDHYNKDKVTIGGKLTGKVEIKGTPAYASLSFGIFNDSYTGLGAEVGVNAGVSATFGGAGSMTAGLGINILSNTQTGADFSISPSLSLSLKDQVDGHQLADASLSASLGYNSRSGMKDLSLGTSFNGLDRNFGSSNSFFTQPISPTILTQHASSYGSFSVDVGGAFLAVFASIGGTGYQKIVRVDGIKNPKPAYGFLYAEKGKNNPNAVMDFIREKDNPIIPTTPNIAIPIHTPDMWSYTSQSGSGQFRLYRGGSGAFFDSQAEDKSSVTSDGGDLGCCGIVHLGVTHYQQSGHTLTHKWQDLNYYLTNGDFQDSSYKSPGNQHVFFRMAGEKGLEDTLMNQKILGTQPLEVNISDVSTANASFKKMSSLYGTTAPEQKLINTSRRHNTTVISYLTADEASKAAVDADIQQYPFYDISGYTLPQNNKSPTPDTLIKRSSQYRKPQHISELTVTDPSGKRMVYGLPVYDTLHEEYSFAVSNTATHNRATYRSNGLVDVPNITTPSSNTLGIDNYYQKESKSPYATSYLLTSILSPDYVDRTGKGISPDDLGTAIKFNYAKLPFYYRWRTPYDKSTLNKCLQADPDDDKGSIVYGAKEMWYVSSIESKTKIAYFITQNRRDALGVKFGAATGGADTRQMQKCLREIRLYSKADMSRPIKVVKFNYTYELCRGIPNSADVGSIDTLKGGKLTLKSVWFEYGNSDKGKYHPYVFQYNKTVNGNEIKYAYGHADRWGTYKDSTENNSPLTNEEFPYTNQNSALENQNVALWHLSQIQLPTGGTIKVDYESNDYAYVQDKKAMVMSKIESLITNAGNTTDTTRALTSAIKGVRVDIGSANPGTLDPTSWFKNKFLNGSNYLYTKLYVKMSTSNQNTGGVDYYDFVPVYCQISSVSVAGGKANVFFLPINESGVTTNPMCNAAWQRLKNDYPRYAYPGFDNRVQNGNNSVSAAVSAIISAARNMSELTTNFYKKSDNNHYCSKVYLAKSFTRLAQTSGFKLGGGARVKAVHITDQWQGMSGDNDNKTKTNSYGQAYFYTTVQDQQTISSGVATYEPAIGNDENPLKQPVDYIQKIKGAISNYYELEMPFCESLYPAPSVGYSKVTVQDLDQTQAPSTKTGYTTSEFYTAKDYPVKVTVMPIINKPHQTAYYSMFKTSSSDQLCLSQGYSIELNDMHGKPKASRVYNQSGAEISSTVYYYNNNGNQVNVIDSNGKEKLNKVIGREIEFFTDFREQETSNNGQTINLGVDVISLFFLPFFPLPHFPINQNNDYTQFRSACALKVIQNYGIVSKVVKTENGSSITTENLAYDELTGEPIVTRTQNEFNKNIYSVNMPAYWAYNGMGPAYQDLGLVMQAFNTNSAGEIPTVYGSYMHGGDEVCDLATGTHYWVIDNQAPSGSGTSKKLINRDGTIKASFTPTKTVKVVRSGFRNMLSAGTSTMVCLNNPIAPDPSTHVPTLQIASMTDLTNLKVINGSASTYDESWAVNKECVGGYSAGGHPLKEDTRYCYNYVRSAANLCADSGAVIYTSTSGSPIYKKSQFFGGVDISSNGYARSSIEICYGWSMYYASMETCFNAPSTQTYYMGVGSYITELHVYVDGVLVDLYHYLAGRSSDTFEAQSNDYWTVFPIQLSAGSHILKVVTWSGDSAGLFGIEIYKNTAYEISHTDNLGTGINTIFTTANVANQVVQSGISFDGNSWNYHFRMLNDSLFNVCGNPITIAPPQVVNPYISGYLGNWRPYQTKVFQQSRHYNDTFNAGKVGIDVKNAGYVNGFYSYWYNTAGGWLPNPNGGQWVNANTVTLYDKYGQQLENQDALLRYSSAKFDFNGELPSAVASNAMNRQIYAASLEDSRFTTGKDTVFADNCNLREFTQPSTGHTIKQLTTDSISHSGNYCVKLPADGVTLSTIMHTMQQKTMAYLGLDNLKQYITQTTTGLYPNGFEPKPTDTCVVNFWVNDGLKNDKSVHVNLNMNGVSVPLTCKALVEGWKLMEGRLNLPSVSGTMLNISILPNNGTKVVCVDDIRIFPKDSQIKTYAYDDKTLRLMAEIDENGFATFYEYDDEGLLIRVKKETERGIMTLKETRSSYKKSNALPFP